MVNHPGNFSARVERLFPTPRRFVLFLAGYFVLQITLRLVASATTDLDESEQLLTTQHLAWGYGAQPPLYTWLQYPLIALLGPTLFPLALLKNALLFGIYALAYDNARRILRDHFLAVLATMALIFVPQLSWESQRDLTHTVLVTFLAVATFNLFLQLAERKSLTLYVLFGLAAGAGCIAKYSFALFWIGLLLGALSLPGLRRVVWDWRMLVALGVTLLTVWPVAVQMAENRELAFASVRKLHVQGQPAWWLTAARGLGDFLFELTMHTGALLGVFAWARYAKLYPARATSPAPLPDPARLIARSILVILGLLLGGIFFLHATNIADRWLLPMLIALPIYLTARLGPQLGERARAHMLNAAALLALVISVAIPTRVWLAGTFRQVQRLNSPFTALRAQWLATNPPPKLIVVETPWLGGNWRQQFPEARILCPGYAPPPGLQTNAPCLVVWNLTQKTAPKEAFLDYARTLTGQDLGTNPAAVWELPMNHYPAKKFRVAIQAATLQHPPADWR